MRGKGPDAASLTALVRYAIRTAAVRETSPGAVLAVVNEALLRDTDEEDFCTAIYASLDVASGVPALRLAVGGHPLPLLAVAGNGMQVTSVGRVGTVLGAVADPKLYDHEVNLRPDDLLLLYTDGVIESRTRGGRLGVDGLGSLLAQCAGMQADAVATQIETAVVQLARDDVALLAVRARP